MGYGNLGEVNTENERDKEISLVRDISRSVVRLVVRLDTPFVFFCFFICYAGHARRSLLPPLKYTLTGELRNEH